MPATCFHLANQYKVMRWEHVADVVRHVVALEPPHIVMPGSYITKRLVAVEVADACLIDVTFGCVLASGNLAEDPVQGADSGRGRRSRSVCAAE